MSQRLAWRDGDRVRAVELVAKGEGRYAITVDGRDLEVTRESLGDGRMRLVTEDGAHVAEVTAVGARRFVRLGTLDFVLDREDARARPGRRAGQADGGLEAPMPGVVTRVQVAAGDTVRKGQPLVAVEAMKMEHVIRAPRDGVVAKVHARAGEMVQGGAALVELEPQP